jgi:hypothetical protein
MVPGNDAVTQLRGRFQALRTAFQMKRAFCVSFEMRRGAGETRYLRTPRKIHGTQPNEDQEAPMKTYRLITLVAAVLITVLFARFLSDEKVGVSSDQGNVIAAQAP